MEVEWEGAQEDDDEPQDDQHRQPVTIVSEVCENVLVDLVHTKVCRGEVAERDVGEGDKAESHTHRKAAIGGNSPFGTELIVYRVKVDHKAIRREVDIEAIQQAPEVWHFLNIYRRGNNLGSS